MIAHLDASAKRLNTVNVNRIIEESREQTHSIGATTNAGDYRIGNGWGPTTEPMQ